MVANFIPIGEPAHDAERQALRFLVEGLPSGYTVYGNPWLVERSSGAIYELDAVVVAPLAVFVVEIKSYRGRIEGTDNDWWLPEKIRSPLKLNRLTAQVLRGHLRHANFQAGQVWVEGVVFLSATTDVGVRGPASTGRIHTRKTILAALQDEPLIDRLSQGRASSSAPAERELLQLFTGVQSGPKPVRRIREYEIVETFEHHDTFTELLGRNALSAVERVLRVYSIPPLATDTQRARVSERARWEAQVLGRIGRSDGILSADPPFADEAGIVLPLEHFKGLSLTTWIERYGPATTSKDRADLRARTDLWIRIAEALGEAHRQGVVHRLLRPEVILVEDKPDPQQIRVTGFDLAKQLNVDSTLCLTTVAEERVIYAAPEVVARFSDAEPASDQFSLGALLALLLTGKPLFESTRHLLVARRLLRRVRDMAQNIPLSLDEAVGRMVELRPTDRFPSLAGAISAVRVGRDPQARLLPGFERPQRLDADNLLPGTRVGTDYEILSLLGQGGLSIVYAARHLVSGRTRALKIAKDQPAAEDALLGEYQALTTLDHSNIVRVIDLTKMVEGRLTLVMERVGGETLRQWLLRNPTPEPATQRRLAEDLLAGLDYLEQKGVTHKDLKPDNLLVSDGRLIIIDFSLAAMPEDAPYGGTALYRDPTSTRWTHATDRYAAALCLFELYAGRHAFDGRVPEPGQDPLVSEDDIDPPGLAAYFRKALNPMQEQRFPSTRAMRDTLLLQLGDDSPELTSRPPPAKLDETTPLRLAGLPRRALTKLAGGQVHTIGELLALSAAQVHAIHAIGGKTAGDIVAFQEDLRGRGLVATTTATTHAETPLLADLCDSPEPVHKLPLSDALRSALVQAGLPTVGAVAALTSSQVAKLANIGRKKLSDVVEALHQFRTRGAGGGEGPHTLDRIWEQASLSLTEGQRIAVERSVGLTRDPEPQSQIADDLGKWQPQISKDFTAGLEHLDLTPLADLNAALDTLVDGFGGIARLDDLGERFEQEWPGGIVNGPGMVRLLVRVSSGRAHLIEIDGADQPLVARPTFDKDTLRDFAQEVFHIAREWPPQDPETARRELARRLPWFDGDPLALGVRLCEDVRLAETGHLFITPVDAKQSIGFVLDRTRDPLALDDLERRVRQIFGAATPYPEKDHLLEVLGQLECRVQGQFVVPGRSGSIIADPALAADEVPTTLGSPRSPEDVVRDMLRDAASSARGFRMMVTPPEAHAEIGRSIATALDAAWVSFEDAFFTDHADQLGTLERAERFVAQREALTEAAEATLSRLVEEHGRPGNTTVLGDTALWGLCEALDLPRRLYDDTLSRKLGFWVLVVPGVIHNRQPRFNEGPAMWHLAGATVPLDKPLV